MTESGPLLRLFAELEAMVHSYAKQHREAIDKDVEPYTISVSFRVANDGATLQGWQLSREDETSALLTDAITKLRDRWRLEGLAGNVANDDVSRAVARVSYDYAAQLDAVISREER